MSDKAGLTRWAVVRRELEITHRIHCISVIMFELKWLMYI